jgi:ABC-type uncharacterized transport system substrate-binding protein
LIVTASATAGTHRDLIVGLVARHRLPAIYYDRSWVSAGGMISYGPDLVQGYRRAATYVDRILRGEKPRCICFLSISRLPRRSGSKSRPRSVRLPTR